jgi:hypothetical protein
MGQNVRFKADVGGVDRQGGLALLAHPAPRSGRWRWRVAGGCGARGWAGWVDQGPRTKLTKVVSGELEMEQQQVLGGDEAGSGLTRGGRKNAFVFDFLALGLGVWRVI